MHAELLASEAGQLNPYRLGLNLLERAYAEGGLAAVDKASRELDDVGLIRAYLTAEDSRRWELALFSNRDDRIAGERSFAELKAVLIRDIEHGGLPHIVVNREMTEAKDGSLYLRHLHDGRDLDFRELPKALEPIAARLWGGRVVLSTVYQKLARVVYHDGREWQDQVTEGAISGLETNTAQ